MARKNIGLSLTLDGKANIKKDLEEIFKYVNQNKKIKLEFDTSSLNNLTELKKALNEIQNNVTKLSSEKILNTNELKNNSKDIDNVTNKINVLEAQKGKISSTSVKFVDGKAVQDITNLNQGLGQTSKIITDLNSKSQTIINTNNIEKQEKTVDNLTNKYNKLYSKIMDYKNSNLFNNSVFNNNKNNGLLDSLKKIDFSNITKASEQLDKIQAKVSNLGSNSTKIVSLKNTIDSFKASFENMKSNGLLDGVDNSKIEAYKNSLKDIESLYKRIKSNSSTVTSGEISNVTSNFKSSFKDLNSNASQIDKVINKIKQLENTFANLKGKYGSLVTDNKSSNELANYESQINRLKSILASLQNGETFNPKVLTNAFNSSKSAVDQLTTSVKNSSNALKLTQRDAMTLGQALQTTLSKLGIYTSMAVLVRKLGQEIKQATQYIVDMDTAMTNMEMITGKSKDTISNVTNEYKNMAKDLHTTNTEMMSGAEELLRAGYSTDTSKSMMESSIIGSKISGQNVSDVTQQLIAMKNAFNMTDEQVAHSVDVISTLDNTASTSFKEIATAVQRTAYSAQQAGTPFDKLASYITVVSEKTRKDAESIGESFKTIYSRYSNIKLGNVDEDGKSINDVEKALSRVGIKIRDSKDQFRDFDDVLQEFMQKYKEGGMSQVDYLASINALAGTR